MDIKFFKDILFDLLNESDDMNISNIETDDKNNIFTVYTRDGNVFEIQCRQLEHQNNY